MNFNLICSDKLTLTTRQFRAEQLSDILQEVEIFLKGCGFYLENIDYDVPSSGCGNNNFPEGKPF